MLTEMKKADRETMAQAVEALCERKDVQCRRGDPEVYGPKVIAIEMEWDDARLGVDFDGSKGPGEDRDVFCMPWCIAHGSEATFSDAFGLIMESPVNQIHRRKCTAFAYGFDQFMARMEAAFDAIASGAAFTRIPATAA